MKSSNPFKINFIFCVIQLLLFTGNWEKNNSYILKSFNSFTSLTRNLIYPCRVAYMSDLENALNMTYSDKCKPLIQVKTTNTQSKFNLYIVTSVTLQRKSLGSLLVRSDLAGWNSRSAVSTEMSFPTHRAPGR